MADYEMRLVVTVIFAGFLFFFFFSLVFEESCFFLSFHISFI